MFCFQILHLSKNIPYVNLFCLRVEKSTEVNGQELIGKLILLFSIVAITNVEFNEVLTFPLK